MGTKVSIADFKISRDCLIEGLTDGNLFEIHLDSK